ncbi:MAG TPA: hypothetical protein PKJ37_12540 [Acidobacteriota bacterium]|nr:hypothetical protein [Acidobacteriota bacterium]
MARPNKTDFQSVSAYLDERLFDLKDRAMRALRHAREAAAAPTQARKHRAFAAIMDMEAGQKMLALSIHEIFDRIVEEESSGDTIPIQKAESGHVPARTGENIQPAAVKFYIENHKTTIKAVAEEAGVAYSSMKKYIAGIRPIPPKAWKKIQSVISKKERR